jgi:hypothetical protein
MNTISPAVADAFQLLRNDLYEHLDHADELATNCDEWSDEDVETARKLIPDLLLVIRGLLLEHQEQGDGACRTCTLVWPCPVVTTIHALVKDPERQFVSLVLRVNDRE